ncbi:MAG: IS21-like element helper ATPase IstB [Candidatus Melainabacteria bacterium]|nr:IS21-like element helper ATPase IstB [Candidatus Melainabacteria bacterium]
MTEELKKKAKELGFHTIVARWAEYCNQPWLPSLLQEEESERAQRSMDRRIKEARLGQFKPMSEFDWKWPRKIDRELIDELFSLQFLDGASNVVLVGPNGNGKSMIAQNLGFQALIAGHSVRFTKASELLDELSVADGAYARRRCLKKYSTVGLLIVDEVGYLSYDNRYADLLYEVITARYQNRSTIVTTNRPFQEWGAVFPNAACVVTLVDRLVHQAEIVSIDAESYRQKEAMEKAAEKDKMRKAKKAAKAADADKKEVTKDD